MNPLQVQFIHSKCSTLASTKSLKGHTYNTFTLSPSPTRTLFISDKLNANTVSCVCVCVSSLITEQILLIWPYDSRIDKNKFHLPRRHHVPTLLFQEDFELFLTRSRCFFFLLLFLQLLDYRGRFSFVSFAGGGEREWGHLAVHLNKRSWKEGGHIATSLTV